MFALILYLVNDCIFSGSQISVASPLGNLKEYVLNGRCEETSIVTFLPQIASALQYLHENHIVHAALRAEHVNVVEFEEVKEHNC